MPSERSWHAFSLVTLFPACCPGFRSNNFNIVDSKLLTGAPIRLLALLMAIGVCIWTINATARVGLSRIFERYALAAGNVAAANAAIEMSPKDAEAYRARAGVLSFSQAPAESAFELERAVALRPGDY